MASLVGPQKSIRSRMKEIKSDDPKDLVSFKPPEVPVDIAEPAVTSQEAVEVLKSFGLTRITKDQLSGLARVGIYLKSEGVLREQRGGALLNQSRLDETMQVLHELIMDAHTSKRRNKLAEVIRLSEKLGYLSTKFTESQRLMIEMEGLTPHQRREAVQQDEAVNMSFIPGQDVKPMIVSKEVHIHNAAPEPAKPPVVEAPPW